MLPPIKLRPIPVNPDDEGFDELPIETQMRRLMARDFRKIWNSLIARAQFGDSDAVKMEAARLLMSYAAGPPPETPQVPQVAIVNAPAARGLNPREMTLEELEAARVVVLAKQRRQNDDE